MAQLKSIGRIIFGLICLVIVAACTETSDSTSPITTPEIDPELISSQAVRFLTEDGLLLVGTMYGQNPQAVLFANMDRTSRHEWNELARELSAKGYMALIFDYRGYDLSQGKPDTTMIVEDLKAAISFLRSQGIQDLALVGAGLGGWAIGKVAGGEDLSAVIIMSSRAVKDEEIQAILVPKLFIHSADESGSGPVGMDHMFRVATEPKEQIIFPSEFRGTTLFLTEHKDQLIEQVVTFIDDNMPVN
jgi:alpha/beta superfamily hydrolase